MIEITINDQKVNVKKGTTILDAAKLVGIDIPTLCYHSDLNTKAVCRVCVVEVEEEIKLVTACSYKIYSKIHINTYSPQVREARKVNIDLLLSSHNNNCIICSSSGECELQKIAEKYGSNEYKYGLNIDNPRLDESSVAIERDYSKCILCRRCIETCNQLQGIGVYSVKSKGYKCEIGSYLNRELTDTNCILCGQCINRCPTGALKEKSHIQEVWDAINDPEKVVFIQTAPAPRVAIGESFNYPVGNSYTYELNTALRKIGFDRVFDTCFTADLTIIEEGLELLTRIKQSKDLPLFTSCSPSWISLIENRFPDFINNLSTAKSPHQMFGAILKTFYAKIINKHPKDIITVSLMPCTAKKYECQRKELTDSGFKDVDYVLTTREIAKMIKESGLSLKDLEGSDFDDPYGSETGSGVIFGSTGGVMESAVRTIYQLVCSDYGKKEINSFTVSPIRGFEGVKHLEFKIEDIDDVPALLKGKLDSFKYLEGILLKVAVCHGTANALKILENISNGGLFKDYHFIEFMSCPGGCIGGGGQPKPTNKEIRKKRTEAIYDIDSNSMVQISSFNSAVLKIYKEFFSNLPGEGEAHRLLHTFYNNRVN